MFTLNNEMVAYGKYYITKAERIWEVTKSGKGISILFAGSYDECLAYCKGASK